VAIAAVAARLMSDPNVVIDVRMLRHAGIGTYIRNVVPRVMTARPSWHFTLLASPHASPDWQTNARTDVATCASDIYTVREQIEIPFRIPARADVFWSPHYNVPVLSQLPLVVTVHDVCHLAMTELYGGAARAAYAKFMFGAVRRRATEILFDSHFTRTEFVRHVGEPRSATTALLGVDAAWRSAARTVRPHERPYVLFVGSAKPHKNLGALIEAFGMSRDEIPGHDLILLGSFRRQRTIDSTAIALADSLGDRVRIVADVEDESVRAYVAHAAALVLPSLYEGFGLPAVEAMAAGCPCLVSNAASLPEVCAGAALYCDPANPADIASQLMRLLSDAELRATLVQCGHIRAAALDWDETARHTASALDRALGAELRVA
jgi:glycosyltransferase involved in cell wall biosynthesis